MTVVPRRLRRLCSFVLLWFVASLGVAMASPVVHPRAMELVCSAAGAVKVIVHTDDGVQDMGMGHMDCPLCVLAGAPPATPAVELPALVPPCHAVQPVPAAHVAVGTATPPPARGPPSLS